MVDLVKIRKKAKSKAEGREQKAEVPIAEPLVPRQEAPPAAPATQDSELRTQDSHPPHSAKLEQFKETAGTKREGFVEEAEDAGAAAQLEVLTFVLAGEHYAVDIEHIVEIVTPRTITRVPNAEEGIVGIISLRGTIVTVVDVRRKLRHPSGNGDHPDRRIIVVEKGGESLGFEVDRVLRVIKTDPGAIEPHPVVHASEQHEAIRGVFRHGSALTILLDFDKLLA
jgi:purine-binding chemotaxis protein CheW